MKKMLKNTENCRGGVKDWKKLEIKIESQMIMYYNELQIHRMFSICMEKFIIYKGGHSFCVKGKLNKKIGWVSLTLNVSNQS